MRKDKHLQTHILVSILIGSVLSSSPAKPQGTGLKAVPLSDATPVVNWPSSGNFLNALTDMGLQNRVPIGIVIQGNSICTGRPRNRGAIVTIRDIVKDLESQAPDYTAEIRDDTLFVHPKVMSASTEATLHLLISEFSTKPGTAYMDGIALWMYIRAKLVPEQGSAFEGQIPPTPDTLPPIRMTHATVEEILDRIVT